MDYSLAALVVVVVVMAVLAYRHQDWMNKHCVCDAKHGGDAKHGAKHGGGAKHGVATSA